MSLATYDPRDPSLNHVVRGTASVRNLAGLFGAYLSALFADMLGFASFVAVAFLAVMGARRTMNSKEWEWWRWLGFLLMGLTAAMAGSAWNLALSQVRGGGLLGDAMLGFFLRYFNPIGTTLIWVFICFLAMQMLIGISWPALILGFLNWIKKLCLAKLAEWRQDRSARLARRCALKQEQRRREREEKAQAKPLEIKTAPQAAAQPPPQAGAPVAQPAAEPVPNPREQRSALGNSASSFFGLKKKGGQTPPLTLAPFAPAPERQPVAQPQSPVAHAAPTAAAGAEATASPQLPPWEKLSLRPERDEEEDLPPWVTDLEDGRIGVNAHLARPVAPPVAPAPASPLPPPASPQPRNQTPGPAPDENSGPLPPPAASAAPSVIIDSAPEPIPPAAQAITDTPRPGPRGPLPLPPLSLLGESEPSAYRVPREELEEKGRTLMTCLSDFNIQGELVRITPGPVVTMFEVRPAPGVKVSRIAGLSDDLALSLKAIAVRVQAPIPGTDTVGIEIPNAGRETVSLKELFASAAFQSSDSLLTIGLGKDISGGPAVADLARMPHLLVAGATGMGKSVFLNSVLLSFLYRARPDEVKLLLIDPKRVEMAIYADLPHLVHPVVTEVPLAKNALDWAVAEMDRRYNDIARLAVRNMAAYNARLAELKGMNPALLSEHEEALLTALEPMPYLVIVIDELADLMLTAGKDVETSIVRLAQLARAAGIHIILATQRPSVDIVTGLIKANFPCRISFQVIAKHDSRTILDTVGAEHLLGKGDMLYKPSGGRLQRVHGAFVRDEAVAAAVAYWKKLALPDYRVDFSDWAEGRDEAAREANATDGAVASDIAADPMYGEAVEFVMSQGKASISLIQRRFRIGFNRAARFIEQMEQDGIIAPPDGSSRPRQVTAR